MKRAIILGLTVTLIMSLCGCAGQDAETTTAVAKKSNYKKSKK